MPRVKRLAVNPEETAIRAKIYAAMKVTGMTQSELAARTGINAATLSNRLRAKGDIGSMRLSELWKIQRTLREAGWTGE